LTDPACYRFVPAGQDLPEIQDRPVFPIVMHSSIIPLSRRDIQSACRFPGA
jgi:hypothetical protein